MTNIILCGGSGTRLWPISREFFPKQFIKLFNDRSLFQLTVGRNLKVCNKSIVVANSEYYFLTIDQLEEINVYMDNYILEPIGRNTAAAIALACLALDNEEIVLVTPSDHLIKNEIEYNRVVVEAEKLAKENNLVMFGIRPKFVETGFGYIYKEGNDVKGFYEKPSVENATKFLEDGNYYWNSGIFMFKAGIFLNELKKYSEDIFNTSVEAFKNSKKENLIRIKLEDMLNIPENSIDYAVMEKSSVSKVVVCDNIDWSDLGSFDALYDEFEKDNHGNVLNNDYLPVDSNRNLIYSCGRKIATIDIDDCIIIDSPDAILIGKRGSSQKVKLIVDKLKTDESELYESHLTTYRPWGKYTVLENSLGYKIKKIEVNPGKRLSLQKHFHRNEHWIVVSGTATVIIEDETKLIRTNESTYIKAGEIHRLSNNGKIPVVLIEVQVGEYIKEDDIIRIKDDYNRII
ncbi:mannose-1-phosphate guanylyltransferase/mannose-6-phosphate isomerase [Campylobacter sp. MOP51]|uniref:mannose-1-phosphate guanylyltransferase/mannose-6-phosphate isomerase n=1 Tax=Campylobacter canis TaxID=3378588 RepID=UPI003C69C00E